jgi:hypothetical protein
MRLSCGVASQPRIFNSANGGLVVRFGLIVGGLQQPDGSWSGGESTNCVVFEPLSSLIADLDLHRKFVAVKGLMIKDKPHTDEDGVLHSDRYSFQVLKLSVRDQPSQQPSTVEGPASDPTEEAPHSDSDSNGAPSAAVASAAVATKGTSPK